MTDFIVIRPQPEVIQEHSSTQTNGAEDAHGPTGKGGSPYGTKMMPFFMLALP